jgi:hypothetical protein
MITFKGFLVELAGTYAAFKIEPESAKQLHEFAAAQGIPNLHNPDHFHITTIYSKKGIHHIPSEQEFSVNPQNYAYFGEADNHKNLVLRVEHQHLHERHAAAIAAGAHHDFPAYEPHITLTHRMNPTDFDHSTVSIPNFPIKTAKEYVEDLKESC